MRFLPKISFAIILLGVGTGAFCQSPSTPPAGPPANTTALPPPVVAANVDQSPRGAGMRRGGLRGFAPAGRSDGGVDAQYSMSFDNADVQSVVKFLSMISKVPIVVDPDLKGNITIVSSKQLTLSEAYEVISAALRVRGYGMVGGLDSKVIRVIPLKKAIVDVSGVVSGKQLKEGVADQDLVTQVVPLEYGSSDTLRDQLRPLISADEASIVSIAANNTLIITDHAGNLRRMMEIIKNCDVDTTGLIVVQVYQCKYASADNLVTTLNALFQPKVGGAQGAAMQAMRARGGDPNANGGPVASAPTGGGLADLRGQISFSADVRTNQVVISATRERINVVLDLMKQLDVDTLPEVKVRCFPLSYADAQATADQLNGMFEQPQGSGSGQQNRGFNFFGNSGNTTQSTAYAGLKRNVVVADVRTNSVVVTATDQNMKTFENVIKELDTQKVLSEVTRVYPLKYARSADLATTLTSLFRGSTSSSNSGRMGGFASIFGLSSSTQNSNSPLLQLQQITVVSEPKTNSLLVTGPPNAGPLMDQMIAQLDKRTAQVFIEVAIVDVTLNKDTQFGVEWQWNDPNVSANKASSTFDSKTDLGKSTLTSGSGLKYSVLNDNVQVLLHALKTRSDVRVLSTPTITTADNVQAKISIGQDVPILSSTITSGGTQTNSVTYQNVSIALTVTPHVNGASDVIGMDVHQLINEIVGTDAASQSPIIADREALTSITVKDGQTIVIGGIIQESKTKATNGIPILSSIPLIGRLFKSTEDQVQKTELMVFLTPRILKTEEDVQSITGNTEKRLSVLPQSGTASLPARSGSTSR